MIKKILAALFVSLFWNAHSAFSQHSFTTVYNILQANCSGSGCHGGANSVSFSVDGSETDVYNALVGVAALNPGAAAKQYKLVDPGHPYNSFLLKKIGAEFDSYLALSHDEGEAEPRNKSRLEDHEIEFVRQWILMGARKSSNDVNYALLQDYYTNGGLPFIPIPQAPEPGKGLQIRFGPIFMAPGEEVEWDKKEHIRNTEPVKVFKTDGYMSWQSHHMLLFKYDDDGADVREGMRLVPNEATPFNGNVTLTGAWQNDAEFELPHRTAFYWKENTILEFDYHIKNYSQTEILPSDFYLNIYFDTENTRDIEMHAKLVNNLALLLFRGETTRVAADNFNEVRYIYMMSSHTHQWGTDYDIFIRNSDGSRGQQIYEGFYNEAYTFNQGYYDWSHPPVRYFTPLQKASHGLIYEVKWNVGVPLVTFGLTADDEMMLFTYMYTKEEVPAVQTSTGDLRALENNLSIAPNPFAAAGVLNFTLEKPAFIIIEAHDLLGRKVATLAQRQADAGSYSEPFRLPAATAGQMLVITLRMDGIITGVKKALHTASE